MIVQVPTAHGKSDMGIYRDFGARTLKLIGETCGEGAVLEKASVDEMYVDLTVPARALLSNTTSYGDLFDQASRLAPNRSAPALLLSRPHAARWLLNASS